MEIADNLTVQGTLTATGGTSGGGAASGANLQKITTVAAAGATLGTATAISSAAREVYATATASTEGVKLPTAVTNTLIRVWASAAVGVKVYAAAAGQKIGALLVHGNNPGQLVVARTQARPGHIVVVRDFDPEFEARAERGRG